MKNPMVIWGRTSRAVFGYSENDRNGINMAGTKAAFDLVQVALAKKIAALGLHVPIERSGSIYRTWVELAAGNLNNVMGKWDKGTQIIIYRLGDANVFNNSSLLTFEVNSPPTHPLHNNSPNDFMDFFRALGFEDFRQGMWAEQRKSLIESGQMMWVGNLRSEYFCPLKSFLKQIGIEEKDFIATINQAKRAHAATLGPVRSKRIQPLLIPEISATG